MLDPTLGRWTKQDPEGYVDGASLYTTYGNNPVLYTDSFGLDFGVTPREFGHSKTGKRDYQNYQKAQGTFPRDEAFRDCMQRCQERFKVNEAVLTCVSVSPAVSVPWKPPGAPLGAPTPTWTTPMRFFMGKCVRNVARRLNPYANGVAAASTGYASGVILGCAVECERNPNAF